MARPSGLDAALRVAAGVARERSRTLPEDELDLRVDGAMVMRGEQCLVEAASEGEAERCLESLREIYDDGRAAALWELGDHIDALRRGGLDEPPA